MKKTQKSFIEFLAVILFRVAKLFTGIPLILLYLWCRWITIKTRWTPFDRTGDGLPGWFFGIHRIHCHCWTSQGPSHSLWLLGTRRMNLQCYHNLTSFDIACRSPQFTAMPWLFNHRSWWHNPAPQRRYKFFVQAEWCGEPSLHLHVEIHHLAYE